MSRVAVFVDAGYLIARGAEALAGEADGRRGVILNVPKVVERLIQFAERKAACSGGILRVYWYDAAGSQPTAEQIRLAESDDVKLRLGTFNSFGKQKGVDSLIIVDMIELARNRAAESFVLVGGDEDLRVGVQVAQTYGIRVHLLGIAIGSDKAQSPGLTREADTNSGWTATDVASFLRIRPAPPAVTPLSASVEPSAPATAVDADTLEIAVKSFYDTLVGSDLDDIRTVWTANRTIPQPYDGRLLARTGTAIGRSLDLSERREIRRIFTRLLERSAGA